MEIIRPESKVEQIPIPNIHIERNIGLELLSFLKKDGKYEFGEENEEAINWIAFCYKNEELKPRILEMLKKHKPFIKESEILFEKVINFLARNEYSVKLLNLDEEIDKREKILDSYKERIKQIVNYFYYEVSELNVEQVVVVPCDEILDSVETGYSIIIGKTCYIMSHTDNLDNFDHEFLHSVINPITEKCQQYFEKENQKNKILKYTGGGIEGYGENPLSILNEELIGTYIEYIKNGVKEITFEQLQQKFQNLSASDFEKIKKREIGNVFLQDTFQDYKTLEDLMDNIEFYYNQFIKGREITKNELRKRLLAFYREYEVIKASKEPLSFEDFFLMNYKKLF